MKIKFAVAFLTITLLALLPAVSQAKTQYYVSLGDSYAVGYQPDMGTTLDGFVYQAAELAKARGYNLKVVNFGCAGATTTSMIKQKGCPKAALGPGAKSYKTTQVKAASNFIRAHRGQIALITVSISGNDVTKCVEFAEPIPCVSDATNGIKANVGGVAKALRKAAGKKTVIVGTTYPDVVLGGWVNPGTEGSKGLANLSVIAFKSLINPALETSYAQGKGKFVDVTAATGAYGNMEEMVELAPYGMIPKPVADVCQISWYCDKRDIHANKAGYKIIAELVVGQLPQK